jgi:hypothetical protein
MSGLMLRMVAARLCESKELEDKTNPKTEQSRKMEDPMLLDSEPELTTLDLG